MDSGVGVGLTGLVGGLISSAVTTLSFSRCGRERPELNRSAGIAILLASPMMFPRLLLEMYGVNPQRAGSVRVPLTLAGATGFSVALLIFFRSKRSREESKPVEFDNPLRGYCSNTSSSGSAPRSSKASFTASLNFGGPQT